MINPSLPEVLLQAAKIGLSNLEAQKFWNHYEAVGWRSGKNRICSWTHALTGWKLRKQGEGPPPKPVLSILDQDLNKLLREVNGNGREMRT